MQTQFETFKVQAEDTYVVVTGSELGFDSAFTPDELLRRAGEAGLAGVRATGIIDVDYAGTKPDGSELDYEPKIYDTGWLLDPPISGEVLYFERCAPDFKWWPVSRKIDRNSKFGPAERFLFRKL